MRISATGLALALLVTAFALAQQASAQMPATQPGQPATQQAAAQAMNVFMSSTEVSSLIAQAKSERKDGQPLISKPILQLAPYNANLEYRGSVGNAALHEREAEMMYVIEGTATMITGGKLVKETRPNADNLAGSGIEGGTSRNIENGDYIMVPENTPHWFSKINGTLILMTLHLPRTVGSPAH